MSSENFNGRALFWGSTAIAVGLAVAWWQEWRRKKLLLNAMPCSWIPIGKIENISLYPLKSGRATDVTEAFCTPRGLEMTAKHGITLMDRSFILYNSETGAFKTARNYPRMVLISTSIGQNGKVIFTAPGAIKELEVQIPSAGSPPLTCRMWYDEEVQTFDCGQEAADWFSNYLGGKEWSLRLGYYDACNSELRSVDKRPWAKFKKCFKKLRNMDFGAFADLASYMMLGESSVLDLNTRLAVPVTASRFRPNFVVSGMMSYDEDQWDWVRIGDFVCLRTVKPCTRCTMITIDPENGVMDIANKEPLRTLKRYRKLKDPDAVKLEGDAPVMGVYLGLHKTGKVSVGDLVYVGVAKESTDSMDEYEKNLKKWWS